MREVEFLPAWYPLLRRRRIMMYAESWALVIVITAMAAWLMIFHHGIGAPRRRLTGLDRQLTQTDADLQRPQRAEGVEGTIAAGGGSFGAFWGHTFRRRLMSALAQIMPPEMTLLDFSSNVVEQPRPTPALVTARGDEAPPEIDRSSCGV